jgi:hypothetical protein
LPIAARTIFIERADGILLPIESLKSNLNAQEEKMLFDDLFYPGNPGRRQQVSDLRGQVRADFMQFTSAWNDCATLLNSILRQRHPDLILLTLTCNVDSDCVQVCVNDFNRVITDAKPKLDKLLKDIGLEHGVPGVVPGSIDMDPEALHKINNFITGAVDASVAAFATWYVYNSIRLFVLVLNYAGAAVSDLASLLAGALGGLIVGAVGFVITDIIASAITGAVERKQLNEAIDALTEFRDKVADPLLKAAGKLAGVVQSIKDGAYKLSDTLLIVKVGDAYQVVTIPDALPSVHVSLVRRDFSDCVNSDVIAGLNNIGGTLSIRKSNGYYRVALDLNGGTPSTTYHFFLKCHGELGTVTTDAAGAATGEFQFPVGEVGDVWAFDMYPSGAPAGNKFQSEPVRMH